jgi:hypothetical protein
MEFISSIMEGWFHYDIGLFDYSVQLMWWICILWWRCCELSLSLHILDISNVRAVLRVLSDILITFTTFIAESNRLVLFMD